MAAKNILLVQLYSNGDCLYATAVARQIKADFPDCILTWAIADFCKDIITGNPFVDKVMVIEDLIKSDVTSFRKLKRQFISKRSLPGFDSIYITQNMDTNQAFYDGCIRSNILNAYPSPLTVPLQPVLRLTDTEIRHVEIFAKQHDLVGYEHVVLFEFAPQSGQSNKITDDFVISVANGIVENSKTAVVLSSGKALVHSNPSVIDGSCLSLRETAALTRYCSLLLGCSSGITWISTSDAARQIPMVQLLDGWTTWVNPVSRDFKRFGLPVESVLELIEFDNASTVQCVRSALQDFETARKKYNQVVPLHFKTTRKIVYNLLCYFEFGAIIQHIRVNHKVYGIRATFYKEIVMAFVEFPFKLLKNLVVKKLINKT